MLKKIQLKVAAQDEQHLHSNWGYALYGMLCAKLDSDYIATLHACNATPISQYLEVLPGRSEAIWHIQLLGAEAIQQVSPVLEQFDIWNAEHHHTKLQVKERKIGPTLEEIDFCRHYLVEQPVQRKLRLRLLTPTGFKSKGNYQIFPSEDLILKSLLRNWHTFAQEVMLDDDEVRTQLVQYTHISDYQLKSVRYPIKGNQIRAFQGYLNFYVDGPEPLVRLVNLLMAFSTYSGVGIKTALGMGGCILF